MRVFLAIELDEAVRREMLAFQSRLIATGADVKWVTPENLHLTLKFFDDIEPGRVSLILDTLLPMASQHREFSLRVAGSGAFPNLQRPRVIWVGAGEGEDQLRQLQSDIEVALAGVGFASEDKPFSPHITLGRVRSPKRLSGVRTILQTDAGIEFGCVRVQSMTLFESQLKREGAEHTPRGEVRLTPLPND